MALALVWAGPAAATSRAAFSIHQAHVCGTRSSVLVCGCRMYGQAQTEGWGVTVLWYVALRQAARTSNTPCLALPGRCEDGATVVLMKRRSRTGECVATSEGGGS